MTDSPTACSRCKIEIPLAHPYAWCTHCGEPLPRHINQQLTNPYSIRALEQPEASGLPAGVAWRAAASVDDSELEQQFQDARLALTVPAKPHLSALLLIGSLAIFVAVQMGGGGSLRNLAFIVAALFIHEGGHWLGMRLFGYRDVKMFFIPFFGAAVYGRPGGRAAWKEAVVLLLGPLPGILLGVVFLILALLRGDSLWRDFGFVLVLLNGFNLLPLGGLDGGRLFQRALFSRHRHLEITFLILAGALLLILGLSLQEWLLAVFAYFGLATIPHRYRILRAAHAWRRHSKNLDADATQLNDGDGRTVFQLGRDAIPEQLRDKPRQIANAMEEIVEAARPAPGFMSTIAVLFAWFMGVLLSLAATVYTSVSHTRHWTQVTERNARFSVELPRLPIPREERYETPAGPVIARETFVQLDLVKRYTVAWFDRPSVVPSLETTAWIDARRDGISRELSAAMTHENPVAVRGLAGREVHYSNGRRVWRVRIFVVAAREYDLFASAPEPDPEAQRFLDSFRVIP